MEEPVDRFAVDADVVLCLGVQPGQKPPRAGAIAFQARVVLRKRTQQRRAALLAIEVVVAVTAIFEQVGVCLLYTSPSPRD